MASESFANLAHQLSRLAMAGTSTSSSSQHASSSPATTSSTSETSFDDMDIERRSPSGASSSLYSYHSSANEDMISELHDRDVSATNYTYALPVDAREHARQDLQHDYLTLAFGNSLYAGRHAVQSALSHVRADGKTPRLADIGAGSGAWAFAMGVEFPHVEVIAIDSAPPHPSSMMPLNCHFEIDDANLSFPHYENYFDVIHIRHCAIGIRDYPALIAHATKMLRPNGVLLLSEPEYRTGSMDPQGSSSSSPWYDRVECAAINAMQSRGATVNGWTQMRNAVEQTGCFDHIAEQNIIIRMGSNTYGQSTAQHQISDLMRVEMLESIYAFRPVLLERCGQVGSNMNAVDEWISYAHDEIEGVDFKYARRWHYIWAHRI